MKFERTLLLFAGFLFISLATCEGLSLTKSHLRNSELTSTFGKKTLIETTVDIKYPDTISDCAYGPDRKIWSAGTAANGYRIGLWDPSKQNWAPTGGAGKRISVGVDSMPWVVAANGDVYAYTSSGWVYKDGNGIDIARCPKHDYTWVIGGDGSVWKWDGSGWSPKYGYGKRVSCDLDGNAWVIGLDNNIWQYKNNAWENKNVFAVDISIAPDGSVFIAGGSHGTGGYDVLLMDKVTNNFVPVGTKAMSLAAVTSSGFFYANENDTMYYHY